MDLWFFIMEMAMLLGGAFLLGALSQRLRQSPILGYLLAGAIAGPLLFNATAVNQAAELGVSLLLFSIGLEFSFLQLRKMGAMAIGGGTVQVALTMTLVSTIMLIFVDLPKALTIGSIVALSSTAVVLRMLVDRSETDSVRGRASLAILLLQDIAIVPLVIMVSLFAPAGPDTHLVFHILKIMGAVVGLSAAFYLLLYIIVPVFLSQRTLFANREMTVLLAISVGLGAAWAAHAIHISPALGAFVAGLLLGESPYSEQIRSDIGTLRIIMVTLFFASVGMLIKPMWFLTHIHWIIPVAGVVFVIKAAIIFGVVRMFGLNNHQAIATGVTLGQVGEFSFVLAAVAQKGGILTDFTIDLIISVIIILILASPYMVTFAHPLAGRILRIFPNKKNNGEVKDETGIMNPSTRVLVVGLGPVGRHVIQAFIENKIEPMAVDVNPKSLDYGKQVGITVSLGDACSEDILIHAGLKEVCMAVVTIPDPLTSIRIIKTIRRLRPDLNITVRCRYHIHMADMEKAGADLIIDEENTTGKILSQKIMSQLEEDSESSLACRLSGQFLEKTD